MALSKSVKDSLKEAESALRNALSYAARQERPMVCTAISDLITRIEFINSTDQLLDKLETKKLQQKGNWDIFFDNLND